MDNIIDTTTDTAEQTLNKITFEVLKYLDARGVSQQTQEALGWGIYAQDHLLAFLGCADHEFPYRGGLEIVHAEGVGQVVAPRSLEIERAKFIEGPSLINKRNTKGAQALFIPPDREWLRPNEVFLCESAVKAAALWQRGYRAVAAAGVASIWTPKRGWVPGWDRLAVLIGTGEVTRAWVLFDSDTETNPNVKEAVSRLLGAMEGVKGPDFRYGQITIDPAEYGEKIGIDDLIAARGDEWLTEFIDAGIDAAEGAEDLSPRARAFAELERTAVYVVDQDKYAYLRSGALVPASGLKRMTAPYDWREANGSGRLVRKNAVDEWMDSEGERKVVGRLDYIPGGERVVYGAEGYFNRWEDSGVAAKQGDITPFMECYRNAFYNDPDVLLEFLDSVSWMLRHRGEKLPRTFLAVGSGHGSGKSTLAHIMGACLGGDNTRSIGAETLGSDFNSFSRSELVVLDDVHNMSKANVAKLKRFATEPTVEVNEKGEKPYTINNTAVFFLTSNTKLGMPIEEGDRRAVVMLFEPKVVWTTAQWAQFYHWLEEEDGYAIMRWYFQFGHEITEGFNPNDQPRGKGKQDIIDGSLSDVEQLVRAIRDDPIDALGSDRKVWTTAELYEKRYGSEELGYARASKAPLRAFKQEILNHLYPTNQGKGVRLFGCSTRLDFIALEPGDWTMPAIREECLRCGVESFD